MLGLRRELADRHVFDHAPAQRAHGLLGHGGAPVLSEVVATPQSQDRTLPLATPVDSCASRAPGALPRERFSPLAPNRRFPHVRCCAAWGKADVNRTGKN